MVQDARALGASETTLLDRLMAQPADSLLSLITQYRDDPRVDKIDVGVGVYKDTDGQTPVFASIKAAEAILLQEQTSKKYLGPEGDVGYFQALSQLVFPDAGFGERLAGLQTPGGTGALRLGADLIKQAKSDARIFVGTPTWSNHLPIFAAVGLEVVDYPYFDRSTQQVLFDTMMDTLSTASANDIVLLQGCCHNPTGADLTDDQWRALTALINERGLLPFIDFAYHGLGEGLDVDAFGVRHVFEHVENALLAYSCDKNFGLYRERTGALFVLASDGPIARKAKSNILSVARASWSMPPDHGAAAVRIILNDDGLRQQWKTELSVMQTRVAGVRQSLVGKDAWFAPTGQQKGMFSLFDLTKEQINTLLTDHAVYMAPSGRVNLAGLTSDTIDRFALAVQSVIGT